MSDKSAGVKRDWCSQCNCWHYEGDVHLDDKIEQLEAELATKNDRIAELEEIAEAYEASGLGNGCGFCISRDVWGKWFASDYEWTSERRDTKTEALILMYRHYLEKEKERDAIRAIGDKRHAEELAKLAARSGEPLPGGDDVHRNSPHATAGQTFEPGQMVDGKWTLVEGT